MRGRPEAEIVETAVPGETPASEADTKRGEIVAGHKQFGGRGIDVELQPVDVFAVDTCRADDHRLLIKQAGGEFLQLHSFQSPVTSRRRKTKYAAKSGIPA